MTSLPLVASARTSMKVSGDSPRDLCLLWRIGEMYEGDKRMRGNHALCVIPSRYYEVNSDCPRDLLSNYPNLFIYVV